VPAQVPYPPPGIEDVIHSPGARRLRKDALLEKAVTMSVISVCSSDADRRRYTGWRADAALVAVVSGML